MSSWTVRKHEGALELVQTKCYICRRDALCVEWRRTPQARKPKYFCAELCWPGWLEKLQELDKT